MKRHKKIKNILWIGLALLALGCGEEFLTTEPKGTITEEQVWSSTQNANLFLNRIYGSLPSDFLFGMDPQENWSDNSMATFAWPTSRNGIARRDYGSSNSPVGGSWTDQYATIRACNIVIQQAPLSALPEADKTKLVAQAKFLRAFFYLELTKLFGGVPVIKVPLDRKSEEDIDYPRSTYDETIDFIRQDLTEAAADLPITWPDNDYGRVTKGAALALRSEAELYASRWEACVATCEEIFNLAGNAANGKKYALVDDYSSLFQPATEKNTEVIFDIDFDGATRTHTAEVFLSPRIDAPTGAVAGWGHLLPTQQLVDSYEFTDGTPGDDPSHASEPYKDRDDRFYASILYDGAPWRGDTIWTRFDPDVKQGTFSNSFDLNHSHQGTLTGYYFRKYLDPNLQPTENSFYIRGINKTNAVLLRLGEIYLNYAEARNQVAGPDSEVYARINALRTRGGLPDLPAGLTKEEMMLKIMNERRVELAFEGKRYWDILRWKIGSETLAQAKKGMRVDEQPNGSLTYTIVNAFGGNSNFRSPDDYLFPVPQTAIEQNPNLLKNVPQNPGF